jgi:hypothetical protein
MTILFKKLINITTCMERVHQYPVFKKLRGEINRWLRKSIDLLLKKILQMIQRNWNLRSNYKGLSIGAEKALG